MTQAQSAALHAEGFWASVREALHGTERDFTQGSLGRAIALLSVPMVLEMAGESLFAVVDSFFVARLGSEALAAVGLTEALLEIVYSIAIGLSIATTALVARRFGEKDPRAAAKVAVQAVWIGVVISALLGITTALCARPLLSWMGASPEVVEIGIPYTRWMMGGMGTILMLFLINGIFRGSGDATTAMHSLWLANAINIVLDPCLIFGWGPFPELGLMGAGVATNIGRGVAVVYQVARLLSRSGRLTVLRQDLKIDIGMARSLLRVSLGGIGQYLVSTASWLVLVRILATFGSDVLAGYVLAIRIVIFVVLPSWGLSNAAATLVGQNLGADKPDRATRSVWLTGLYNMLFMCGVTIVFVVFSKTIVGWFTNDDQVVPIAVDCLKIISYGYGLYAWGMVFSQAFNGAGDTWTPTYINLICFWVFQIPLAYLLAHTFGVGPQGVFWAIAISYSLTAVLGVGLFQRGRWKQKKV